VASRRELQNVREVAISREQHSFEDLGTLENLPVSSSAKPEVPHVVGCITSLAKEPRCRTRQIFIDEKAQLHARARISCCSRTLAA